MPRILVAFALLLVPVFAEAQQFSPTNGKLRVGQEVYVVLEAPCTPQGCGGEFVDGRVAALTKDVIAVESQGRRFELPAREVMRVETRGDSLWNGLAYGSVFGFVAFFVAFIDDCGDSCDADDYGFLTAASGLYGGSIGAAVGVITDAFIRGNRVVFQRGGRASIAPLIGRGGGGVRVSVRF